MNAKGNTIRQYRPAPVEYEKYTAQIEEARRIQHLFPNKVKL